MDACGWMIMDMLNIPYATFSGGPMLYHADRSVGAPVPFSHVPAQVG
jgi:hypothetical protein